MACTAVLTGQGGDGTCGPVENGGVDALCVDQGAASCGTDGACVCEEAVIERNRAETNTQMDCRMGVTLQH